MFHFGNDLLICKSRNLIVKPKYRTNRTSRIRLKYNCVKFDLMFGTSRAAEMSFLF